MRQVISEVGLWRFAMGFRGWAILDQHLDPKLPSSSTFFIFFLQVGDDDDDYQLLMNLRRSSTTTLSSVNPVDWDSQMLLFLLLH